MIRRKWWQARHPFWQWLLRLVAWSVLITFLFLVMATSIHSLLKMLQ
jgi:hypothetical protein